MINPLVDQELYIYDCYAVDITDSITILRPVSKHVQPKINATVVSNLPPQRNSRHMRNNMPDRCGHVSSMIKNPKVMTNVQSTSTIGPSMKGGTCTRAFLTHAQLMATHLGMTSSTWSGGICRRTMACTKPAETYSHLPGQKG